MSKHEVINWSEVYSNPDISREKLEKIAEILSKNKDMDLMKCFDLLKCSSKFCWLNFLNILEKMPDEEWIRGVPFLFHLLQDPNWTTYEKRYGCWKESIKKFLRHL